MTPQVLSSTHLTTYALRLHPGDDLRSSLQAWANDQQVQAAFPLTAVGSLEKATLRFAGQETGTVLTGPLELVSLVGTLSGHGLHLHATVADRQGHLVGGHVLLGCRIYTTAEIVMAELSGLVFQRPVDPQTGYPELRIAVQHLS